jgi:hypothetical protein
MDGIAPGPALVSNYMLFLAVRQLVIYLLWLMAAALAGAGACWCCGYGATAVWARAESARRSWREVRRTQDPLDVLVSAEAERGIHDIEEYLAVRSAILPGSDVVLPRPDRVDEDENG